MPDFSLREKYNSSSVMTMTPGQLVIFLFDKAAFSACKAAYLIKKNKPGQAHEEIIRAENIILYLTDILDFRVPIAEQLYPIYEYIRETLIQANIKKDCGMLDQAARLLSELKDTWAQTESALYRGQSSGNSL